MATRTVYLVQHLNWKYNDEQTVPEAVTVQKAFARREAAEAYRDELTRRRLADGVHYKNPFDFNEGRFRQTTGRTEAEMADHFRALRLPLPAGQEPDPEDPDATRYDWKDFMWWEAVADRLEAGDIDPVRFWAAFDRVQYYEVVEAELEG